MKVHLQPPQPSRGLQRIADALVKYKPEWAEVVGSEREADLVVIYAIGRRNQVEQQCVDIWRRGKKYAIIQICLRSTLSPKVDDWLQTPDKKLADEGFEGIWLNVHVIWSYYDLNQACVDDGWSLEHDGDSMWNSRQFYHAPLGVESEVFYPRTGWWDDYPNGKYFKIATSGLSYLSESVRESWLAAEVIDAEVMHIGKQFNRHNVVCADGISDDQLAEELSACEFVSALRRKEGFELPAAEGLLCGARPIAFNTPDYRWIYKDWAEYIEETDRQGVVDQLVELFRRGARPVTQDEIDEARAWFHWPTIIGGFYERLQ